jgi:N-acetylglucosaminyl-diphospho-decaprenol L-rhamnosyltransferase
MDVTIVIPVHNQLHFTRQCLESLNACGYPDRLIVVVDNASTDGTATFLAGRPDLRVIRNPKNRACAAAWNQGFKASTTRWTVFLNNDTVSPPGWLESLIAFAEKNGVTVASPAMAEGELDYDLNAFACDFIAQMNNVVRSGTASGACFMVAREVFAATGGFDENFTKGGNEDDDFFWRARDAGFKLAISGGAFIHHFGRTTQNALLAERGSTRKETVTYFRKKWKISWLKRRSLRLRRKIIEAWWKWSERLGYGRTLNELHLGGKITYR